jgi:hypothetical protein
MFRNSLFRLFCFYTKTESFDVSIEPKQTEDQSKLFQREHIWVFFRKFRDVSVRFGCYRNFLFLVSQNKPKHNRNRSCFGLFRFEPNFFLFVSRTPYTHSRLDQYSSAPPAFSVANIPNSPVWLISVMARGRGRLHSSQIDGSGKVSSCISGIHFPPFCTLLEKYFFSKLKKR